MLEVINRTEFVQEVWSYHLGEHVTFLGPTGSGKTQLKWEVLQHTVGPQMRAVVAATKPRDKTTEKWRLKLGFRKVRDWPPMPDVKRVLNGKALGIVLWPLEKKDADAEEAAHYRVFKAYLDDAYHQGDQIADIDEVLDFSELKLEKELRRIWTRGRSMGTGLWAGTQQPFHIPTHAYRQAEHLFVAKDPDQRSRQRYNEIGGIDGKYVQESVMKLRRFQFLYMRRSDSSACIIDK